MARQDICDDVAAILHPLPEEDPDDPGTYELRQQAWQAREEEADNLRTNLEESDGEFDPLLAALGDARRRRLAAEAEMQALIAYAREFVRPRPYRLIDLAETAGMSISGARTTYDDDEIEKVVTATGTKPRDRSAGHRS